MPDKRAAPECDTTHRADAPETPADEPGGPGGRELTADELSRVSGGRSGVVKMPLPPAPFIKAGF